MSNDETAVEDTPTEAPAVDETPAAEPVEPPTAEPAVPGLRGRRVLALAVGGGLALGLGSFLLQMTFLSWTANSVGTWSVVAFLVGALVGPPTRRAIAPSVTILVVALLTWYAIAQAVRGMYDVAVAPALVRLLGAVIAGVVFGVAGSWWRWRCDSWRAGFGLALLVALLASDALHDFLWLHGPVTGWTRLVVAVAAAWVLGRRLPRYLANAPLLMVPLTAAGLAGHAALVWALNLSGG